MSDYFKNEEIQPDDEKPKKKSLNEITKELLDQLRDNPNDLFMSVPLETQEEPPSQQTNDEDVLEHIKSFNIKPKQVTAFRE